MQDEEKFTYLILHYQTINDTIECVNSIFKYSKNPTIVIVDNGSKNNSGNELKEKYKDYKNIYVLISNENLGFARGNNLGIKYIKDNFNTEFICMMNNDTEIIDSQFEKKIRELFAQEKFAVLGPKIILKDKTINPVVEKAENLEEIKNVILKNRIKLICNYLHIEWLLDKLKKDYSEKHQKLNRCDYNKKNYNVMLHGCFLVFSKKYFEKFDGLYDKTFLYCEEEFLYYRLEYNNLISIYDPNIYILHKEYSSTKSIHSNESKYKRFRYKNLIKSEKLLLDFLKKERKDE